MIRSSCGTLRRLSTPEAKVALRTLDGLLAAMAVGLRPVVRFFPDCGGAQRQELSETCLSQWWSCEFHIGDASFRSAEQAMMYGKALLFEDQATATAILASKTQFQAMELGRQVKGFSEGAWERHREEIVYWANLPKFAQNEALGAYLLSTGDDVLAEASPVDRIWGIGHAAGDPYASDPRRWSGKNLLGFVLMRIREELRDAESR